MFSCSLKILLLVLLPLAQLSAQTILLFEDFESGDFAAKGWYDGFPDQRTTAEAKNGTYAYAGRFLPGATTSGAGRHLFTPTDKVYISYWVKYSTNYVGSGVGYHPHEWNILTDADWEYQGPADTYLTTYIEQNAGRPILALQDSKNVDPNCILLNNNNFVGCNGDFNSYPFTEYRSVCSCNGLWGDVDRRECFSSAGSTHGYYSARAWAADSIYFRNEAGPYYKNDWHLVEALFEMNTIENTVGVPNGKIRYWLDGNLLITSDSILFRTAIHPDLKFNQLLYGPYIGVGSPVDQTWWIDDLTIADGRPTTFVPMRHESNLQFSIAPNPITDDLSIYFPGAVDNKKTIAVFSSIGQLLLQQLTDEVRTQIHFPYPAGIYVIHVVDENGTRGVARFVKVK